MGLFFGIIKGVGSVFFGNWGGVLDVVGDIFFDDNILFVGVVYGQLQINVINLKIMCEINVFN